MNSLSVIDVSNGSIIVTFKPHISNDVVDSIVQAVDNISNGIISDGGTTNVNVSDGVIFVTGDIYGGSVRSGSACALCCVLYIECALM
jgi:hypothetical protein